MTTTYNKSLSTDLSNNLNVNQLLREINEDSGISPNCITVNNINSDSVDIIFESALSGGEQTVLNTIISNHNPINSTIPFTATAVLNNNDVYIANHFYDPDYDRKIKVSEETSEVTMDTTYVFNNTYISDFQISDTGISELSLTSFNLVGSGFQKGSSITHDGTASASSTTQPASNANDQGTTTFWYNSNSEPAVGSWWKVDFGTSRGIYSAEVIWYSTTYYATDVSIEYSMDDTNWTLGLRDQAITYTSTGNEVGYYEFADFASPIFARYFRFTCNASNNATYFIMKEVYLYQAVGSGFSTIDSGTINNIKTLRQIDTSAWPTINSSTLIGTFPVGTTTRLLLSFDNQTTWVYWNGSAWTTSSIANITTTSMTHTTFNALTLSNYAAANGLNSGSNSIDVAINISTSDDTLTPILNSIEFNYNTDIFRQMMNDNNVRIRCITDQKTEIKNISGSTKTFKITIDQ